MTNTALELTDEEIGCLQKHQKLSPLILVRSKASAVLLYWYGADVHVIARSLGKHEEVIKRWLRAFLKVRMASLFTGHACNHNASKLTQDQKSEVRNALSKPPSDYGLPANFWDVPTLKNYVQTNFEVVYESKKSYHLLLKFGNLSFKRPDTFDRRRDEKAIRKRMREIRKELKPMLESNAWEVFVADETRIQLEAETRRAWLKRGEKTVVKVNRTRKAQSYLGFLNLKSASCDLFELPWQNQEYVIRATVSLVKKFPERKVCIVWDNAAFHKGKRIRRSLGKRGALRGVHLINLPPYAPDYNPIEKVWNYAKGKISNRQLDDLELVKKEFVSAVSNRKFRYARRHFVLR